MCFSVGYRTKRNCNFLLIAASAYRKGDLKIVMGGMGRPLGSSAGGRIPEGGGREAKGSTQDSTLFDP